jgi:hypothetical protein
VKAKIEKSTWGLTLFNHYVSRFGLDDPRLTCLSHMIEQVQALKKAVGRNSAKLLLAIAARLRKQFGTKIKFQIVDYATPQQDVIETEGIIIVHLTGVGRNGRGVDSYWDVHFKGVSVKSVVCRKSQ